MLSDIATTGRSRAAFILAGGKSSRMGEDKAFLEFRGQSLLDRAFAVATAVCDTVAIVGDPAKFARYRPTKYISRAYRSSETESLKSGSPQSAAENYASVVPDLFPNCGPLAGIHSALMNSSADLNLMLAVDMPFVSAELLDYEFAVAAANGAIVTVPRTSRGLQPLCAIYRHGFATAADEALRMGNFKIDSVFPAVSIHVIEERDLTAAGFSEDNFFNVNTPQDRLNGLNRSS